MEKKICLAVAHAKAPTGYREAERLAQEHIDTLRVAQEHEKIEDINKNKKEDQGEDQGGHQGGEPESDPV